MRLARAEGSTSFDDALRRLNELASEGHETTNRLGALAFADERGWLSDAEKIELIGLEKRSGELTGQVERALANVRRDHADRWRDHVESVAKTLLAIETGYLEPKADTDADFDRAVAKDLLASWRAVADGRSSRYSPCWTLAVAHEMARKYL